MRIIAGKYRRRKLLPNPGRVTRPITDRVKETLFEYLRDELQDRHVADVFSGTGTLGLEALSRGARSAVFIENDRRGFDILRRNVETLDVERETLCWRTDVLRCSFRPKGRDDCLPYDVIFCDPPYRMIAELIDGSPLFKSIGRLARDNVSQPNARLILRTPERSTFELPEIWQLEQTLTMSKMNLHLCRKQPGESLDPEAKLDNAIAPKPELAE